MSDDLLDLIKTLQKENPKLLEGLATVAAEGLKQDKLAIYNIFVKENQAFTYEKFEEILRRHENSRLDINWNRSDFIYRIVVSRRERKPEKERKPRTKKDESNGSNQSDTEKQSAVNQ